MELKKPHADWLDARRIDPIMAEKFGIHTMPRSGRNWLAIPYVEQGKVVNHKYRLTSESHGYQMDDGAPLTLWNHDVLLDASLAPQPLIITEGEWDALAILSAGKRRVVSVPNGAPQKSSDDDGLVEGKRYAWFWRCEPILSRVEKVILCVDNDEAGRALSADLCRLFGPERCMFVTYPEHCKDANEVLDLYGHDALVQMLDAAKPYPIKGLYVMDDFPEREEIVSYPIGIDALDDMMAVVPGTLTVLTGYANMGKSSVMNAIMGSLIRLNIPVCIASFETDVKPILRDHLRAAVMGCTLHDARTKDMSSADELIRDNITIITQLVDEDDEMDLTAFLELCRTSVIRDGTKVVVLDPWNELEHKRRSGESETDYISRALRAIKKFTKQYNVAFWIVAHPTKPFEGRARIPGLYDVSGCYSDDTEVLTKRGWQRHSELLADDEVACYDLETQAISYAIPTRIIRKPFCGHMHRIKGYGYDLLVTPDHRMVVKPMWPEPTGTQSATGIGRPVKWVKDKWTFCEAADLPSAPFNLPIAGNYEGDETGITEVLAALAGWYVSEGCAQSSGVSISQARGKKADKIEALLIRLSIPYSIIYSAPGGKGGKLPMQAFYIGVRGGREVVAWLRNECGMGSANKRIPYAIFHGRRSIRQAFLSAFLDGDGSYREASGSHAACTTSPYLRDQIQALAVGLGYSCCWTERPSVSERHAKSWHLVLGTNGRCETAVRKYRNITHEAYEGFVWCLTVPTGAYVVRRNGKATVCGNSANWANKADYGLTYHRKDPETNSAELRVTKVRMGLPGRKGSVFVTFDHRTSSFRLDENELQEVGRKA